ncbi:MAG: glycosyltransferase family 4 protein [Acidobacteria bacterium]|nr:glycosyltransferase family 4 protein [Acidobacteriota bacterium]
MRVAFASHHHQDDVRAFSGIPYFMSRAIQADSEFFEYIQCPDYSHELVQTGGKEGWDEIERIGRFLTEHLHRIDVDVVICLESSMIPFVKTEKPVVLWHDSTWFSLMQMDFDQFKSRHPLLYEWDRLTLDRCDLIAFAADWVKDQVLTFYGVASGKIHVVPFGANIEPVSQKAADMFIAARDRSVCRLGFLGMDWVRKGLPLGYQVAAGLNANHLRANLTVMGCDVPPVGLRRKLGHYLGFRSFTETERFRIRFASDAAVNKMGFLAKDIPSQKNRICEVMQNTHFLLHPADFECYGIALVEANAFGVPVLATDSYGPKTIVRDGFNGHLFDKSLYVKKASECIQRYMNDIESYRSLARSSFAEYSARYSWPVCYGKLKELTEKVLPT